MIVLCLPRFVGKIVLPVKTYHKHSADDNSPVHSSHPQYKRIGGEGQYLEVYHNMQRNYHGNLLHTLHLGGIQASWRMNIMADP
jgi:hypothetical protein